MWANEINWPLTLETLSPSKITSLKTDQLDNNQRSFRFKTWFKELPTIDKLHSRNPIIYTNNICKICNREPESDLHPFICGTSSTWLK